MKNLKTLLTSSVLVFLSVVSSGQTWVEPGHEIRFYRTSPGVIYDHDSGCETWVYSSDSLISGNEYHVLSGTYIYQQFPSEDTIYLEQSPILLRTDEAQTWWWYEGEEHLLADFGAQVGDQWPLPVIPNFDGFQSPDMQLTVTGVTEEVYGNVTRAVMHYDYYFDFGDDCEWAGEGMVVQGLYHRMDVSSEFIVPILPDNICTIHQNDLYFFCYYSNEDGAMYGESCSSSSDCDISVGVDELNSSAFSFLFDPAHGSLQVQGDTYLTGVQVEVRESSGRLVIAAEADHPIDLSRAERGVYIVTLRRGSNWLHTQRILILR